VSDRYRGPLQLAELMLDLAEDEGYVVQKIDVHRESTAMPWWSVCLYTLGNRRGVSVDNVATEIDSHRYRVFWGMLWQSNRKTMEQAARAAIDLLQENLEGPQ